MSVAPITTIKTVVEKIADVGAGVKRLTLVEPEHWELPSHRPGAHIDLHLPGGLVRTYSLCNEPEERLHYVVAVKREDAGRGGSALLHDRIKVGDAIGVSLPRGGLRLHEHASRLVFVAGGIGVTPFLSMAAFLKRAGRPDFKLHMIARGLPPLADQLAPLVETGHAIVHDTTIGGRPSIVSLIGEQQPDLGVACRGPESMISDFEDAIRGWPEERVHLERFVPPPLAVDPNSKPYTLVLSRSNREIIVRAGQSMLSALQDSGIDIPISCGGGICGSCRVRWLEGAPLHRDRVLSAAERAHNLMVCVAGSAADRLVLDL
jgi:ferredoxin-NADP reductase